MKHISVLLILLILCTTLFGCNGEESAGQIAATTLPVYEFTQRLCQDTDLSVIRMVNEEISCLHDYALQARQMRIMEDAQLIITTGAEFDVFLDADLMRKHKIIDASINIPLHSYHTEHDHSDDQGHAHTLDPHYWLSPENAKVMAKNICNGLTNEYPQYRDIFEENLKSLLADLDAITQYANAQLKDLSCRQIITFHDGFSYMAEAFSLEILHTIEEESGSEASAAELIALIKLVRDHKLDAIFTEQNGSTSAAQIISAETAAEIYPLDMAIAGDSYFDAMYHNIDTLKEALE